MGLLMGYEIGGMGGVSVMCSLKHNQSLFVSYSEVEKERKKEDEGKGKRKKGVEVFLFFAGENNTTRHETPKQLPTQKEL